MDAFDQAAFNRQLFYLARNNPHVQDCFDRAHVGWTDHDLKPFYRQFTKNYPDNLTASIRIAYIHEHKRCC